MLQLGNLEWLHNDWTGAVRWVFEVIEMLRARQCVSHMLGQISTASCLSVCLSVYLSELSTYCSRSRIGRGRDGQGWMGEMGETHISGRGKTCMHVSARRRDGKACLRSKPNFFFFRKGGKGFQVETCVLVNKSVSCRREFALAPGKPSSVQAWTRLGQMPGSRLEVEGRLGRLVCTFQV